MMKQVKIFLIGVLMGGVLMGQAQSLAPEVLSNAGSTNHVGNISIAWTLGEVAVAQWATPSGGSVSEGFHQPSLKVSRLNSASIAWVNVVPNPVQSTLQLIVDKKEAKTLSATLLDVQGKILKQLPQLPLGTTSINVEVYASGIYFLSIQYVNELPLQTFKIVKLQ